MCEYSGPSSSKEAVRELEPRGKVDHEHNHNHEHEHEHEHEYDKDSLTANDPLAPLMDEALLSVIAPLLRLNGERRACGRNGAMKFKILTKR